MLALIPARGGSKGLPGKNIRPLLGKPLIAYTILAAKSCPEIDRVIISTDDEAIATVARAWGAEVPFLRPADLATDTSPAIDTYLYTCAELERLGAKPIDQFVVLLPTAPLRKAFDITAALTLFHERQAEAVISVMPSHHPIHWTRKIDASGVLRSWLPDGDANRNRQEYAPSYLPNGSIYVFNRAFLARRQGYYGDRTYPYMMPKERSIDIDDLSDFLMCESLMQMNPLNAEKKA